MSRPLVCDNPGCETEVSAADVDALLADLHGRDGAASLPCGWVVVSEVDEDGDDVVLGEYCSRVCAAGSIIPVERCTRRERHEGPCNGIPRVDCPLYDEPGKP